MQTVFADPDSLWATPGFAGIVPVVQRLVDAYAPRVVLTRFVAPAQPTGAWVSYYEQWPYALVPPDDPLYDIVPEVDRPARPPIRDQSGPGTNARAVAPSNPAPKKPAT